MTSQRVDEIENVVREVGELIAQDVTANSQNPRYYYTKLADLKLQMVAAASEDARDVYKRQLQCSVCRPSSSTRVAQRNSSYLPTHFGS